MADLDDLCLPYPTVSDIDALGVPCPVQFCAAPAGTECHTPGMSTQGTHVDRADAAIAACVKESGPAKWTPTTEQVRDGYAYDPEDEYRDPINAAGNVRQAKRAFDRWLEQERVIARAEGAAKAASAANAITFTPIEHRPGYIWSRGLTYDERITLLVELTGDSTTDHAHVGGIEPGILADIRDARINMYGDPRNG